MHLNISQVLFFTSKYVSSNLKLNSFISGLGPDEFFCGYHKNKNKFDCSLAIKAAEDIHIRNIQRDYFVCQQAGIESIHFPYLEDTNVQQIIFQSYTCLNNDELEDKKLIREAIKLQNILPEKFVSRAKKAMQFGSGASRILGRVDGEVK